MRSFIARHPLLVALFCSALLMLRVGEAHLHLCYDGLEAASELHLIDVGVEHAEEAGAEHQDTNITLGTGELAKPPLSDLDLPLVLLALLLFVLATSTARATPLHKTATGFVRSAAGLRPPLRGPPLTARA